MRCWSPRDWARVSHAYARRNGVTFALAGFASPYAHSIDLSPDVCSALARIRYGDGDHVPEEAYALNVLAHESMHLLEEDPSEAQAECYAMQRIVRVGTMLGMPADVARRRATYYFENLYPGHTRSTSRRTADPVGLSPAGALVPVDPAADRLGARRRRGRVRDPRLPEPCQRDAAACRGGASATIAQRRRARPLAARVHRDVVEREHLGSAYECSPQSSATATTGSGGCAARVFPWRRFRGHRLEHDRRVLGPDKGRIRDRSARRLRHVAHRDPAREGERHVARRLARRLRAR